LFVARLGADRRLEIGCVKEATGHGSMKLVADAMASVPAADVRYAAIWAKGGGEWIARHDLSAEQFQNAFNAQAGKGMQLAMVDGYQADGAARYAAIWDRGSSPRVARHGMTAADYQQAFGQYSAAGYRLVWVDGYTVNGSDRYAAIWEKSKGPAWIAHHGLTASAFQKEFDELVKGGYQLKLVSGYTAVTQTRYVTLWEKPSTPLAWVARIGIPEAAYQKEFEQRAAAGYRLAHVSGYRVAGQIQFAAIWDKAASPPWIARHNMTADEYQQQFNKSIAQGYKLVEVSGY
jgi:hypothetical protein